MSRLKQVTKEGFKNITMEEAGIRLDPKNSSVAHTKHFSFHLSQIGYMINHGKKAIPSEHLLPCFVIRFGRYPAAKFLVNGNTFVTGTLVFVLSTIFEKPYMSADGDFYEDCVITDEDWDYVD